MTWFLVPIQTTAMAIDLHRCGLNAEKTQGIDTSGILFTRSSNEIPVTRNGGTRNTWTFKRSYIPVSKAVLVTNRTVVVGNRKK